MNITAQPVSATTAILGQYGGYRLLLGARDFGVAIHHQHLS